MEQELSEEMGKPVKVAINDITPKPDEKYGWAWHVKFVMLHIGYGFGAFFLNEDGEMERILDPSVFEF